MAVLLESFRDGVKTITLNRPKKKNALNREMYLRIAEIFNEDAKNDEIVVTILTGVGDYFTSGNDLSSASITLDPDEAIKPVEDMVQAFINYPKLIICVVNGIAIGIGATIITLCDIVYASDKAAFDTPFLKLGLCVEGTSSLNFPLILGRSLASEVLFLNRRLTAQEALHYGLVSRIIPHNDINRYINDLHKYGKLAVGTVKRNKAAIMANFRQQFTECNKRELGVLKECVTSEDFANSMAQWFASRSKL
ncbi:enoyl-CoA delta isomerase 2-like [Diabrotica undecimpunctata]|uniref:enoyl-CoA delta isomerase 2-like n=1 Tax=Diabrotica undecimpunctata TaxID=50387 RepID=UPI003B634009